MQVIRDIYPKENCNTFNTINSLTNTVKIRLLKGGFIPTRATKGSIGYDLYSPEDHELGGGEVKLLKMGIRVFIPNDLYSTIEGRSGMNSIGILVLRGIIDTDYTGELGVIIFNTNDEAYTIKRGDRIAQIIFSRVENVVISKDIEMEDSELMVPSKKERRNKRDEKIKKKIKEREKKKIEEEIEIEEEDEDIRGENGFGSSGK